MAGGGSIGTMMAHGTTTTMAACATTTLKGETERLWCKNRRGLVSAGGARSGKEVDPLAHLHPAEAAADLFQQLGRFGFSGEEGTVTAHAMTARWIEVAARSYWQRLSNTNWPHIILAEIMRNPHIGGLRFSNEQDRASANLPTCHRSTSLGFNVDQKRLLS